MLIGVLAAGFFGTAAPQLGAADTARPPKVACEGVEELTEELRDIHQRLVETRREIREALAPPEEARAAAREVEELERRAAQLRREIEALERERQRAAARPRPAPPPAVEARPPPEPEPRLAEPERPEPEMAPELPEPAPEPEEEEEGRVLLRSLGRFHPLRVEDAIPADPGLEARLSMTAGNLEGATDFIARPELALGLPWRMELGAGVDTRITDGDGDIGPVRVHAMGTVLGERGARPALGLRGELDTAEDGMGVSGQLALLATQRLGATRAHVAAELLPRRGAADAYALGLAGDHPLGDRLLVLGDARYERLLGGDGWRADGELGGAIRLGERVVLQGVFGVSLEPGGVVSPRVIAGVSARP